MMMCMTTKHYIYEVYLRFVLSNNFPVSSIKHESIDIWAKNWPFTNMLALNCLFTACVTCPYCKVFITMSLRKQNSQ